MAAMKYTLSISADFPYGKVATGRLNSEIRKSAITIALDYINTSGDDCDIWFKDELPESNASIIDVDTSTDIFTISGDHTEDIGDGDSVRVINSTGNNGLYVASGTELVGSDTDVYVPEDIPDATVDGSLSWGQETILRYLASVHSGEPESNPTEDDGTPIMVLKGHQEDEATTVAIVGRIGSEFDRASHNLCDKTTWFTESVGVTGGAFVDSGDGLTFNSSPQRTNIVCTYRGRLMKEHKLDAKYLPKVYIDSVEAIIRNPIHDSWDGEDCYIDYENGNVVFRLSQVGNTITADYYYEDGSKWIMEPGDGKVIIIEDAEAQFASNVQMNSTVYYEVEGYCIYFAPAFAESNGGPIPDFTQIVLDYDEYKTIYQMVDQARGAYPQIPAIGGSPRGLVNPMYGFPFRYMTIRSLYNTLGMRLVCRLENDVSFGGDHATVTFYCTSRDERSGEPVEWLMAQAD